MAWIEAEYDDPLLYRMLGTFTLITQLIIEYIIPTLLGYAFIILVIYILYRCIATPCGWNSGSGKKAQDSLRDELVREMAERAKGKVGSGYLEKPNELEILKFEMEIMQEMLSERIWRLDTLAAREKGE